MLTERLFIWWKDPRLQVRVPLTAHRGEEASPPRLEATLTDDFPVAMPLKVFLVPCRFPLSELAPMILWMVIN